MFRFLIIAIVSLCSLFPFMIVTTQYFGLSDDAGAAVSVVLGWLILPAILLQVWKSGPGPEVLPVDMEDPIMKEMVSKSKAEIGRFLKGLEEGRLEALIKFPLAVDDGVEHVWGLAHGRNENSIIVSLLSEPVGEIAEDARGRMTVPIEDVEDWTLQTTSGKSYGGYTMLAMARIYERDYGKLPKRYAKDLESFVDFKWRQGS